MSASAPSPPDSPPYSQQPPFGLPAPLDNDGDAESEYDETLMSCFGTISISSLATLERSTAGAQKDYPGPHFSSRATTGPDAGPLIDRFSCLFKNQYDADTNPHGIVSLGVAENFLMQQECFEIFTSALKNMTPLDLSYGDSLWGSRRINKALSGFLNDYFHPVMEIKPDHLITGVGCSAVLDQLFYTLLDEGDAILVAAPYYTGFDRDLISRGKVKLIPIYIPIEKTFTPEGLELFEAKYEELKKEGTRVRAVIVCNPQNPMGRPYPRETLLAYARFCEEKDLHLVSDEIYGMSVYENAKYPGAVPFTSFLSLDLDKELPGITFEKARLHVIYGMSKDFCANGFGIGALITPANPTLIRTMANTSMLMKLSSPADIIWSSLLNDKKTLSNFLETNKGRLGEAQAFVRDWFEERGVVVADSNAGNFVWVNIGEKLGGIDVATEKNIFQRLLDSGVYIAPGTAYHYDVPGWYRITFTVARKNLVTGLERIERVLGFQPLKK
ncbi:hypothetical protein L198_02704 [Cryptococcus wingfieldii CBS 7118]|uniref:Aminotransferase class I/classII large domain-containing protein n=1 Tax=Cryptococcus wingfieldii CBS 7118 TaxID=1295528 RepID=A0A1E3JMD3_9TREE|nr:hypothetical protein L198_02704 [Cryptococcus wingfieldii CBS 7118]ODO01973.1 hypothetical protein L198_02704 [Cryptococcus wingfieldii CBS 7118]